MNKIYSIVILLIASLSMAEDTTAEITKKVFFDITIDGESVGRIIFGLYGEIAPRTVENFRALSTCETGMGNSGHLRCYRGSRFHRIITQFMIQGGDFVSGDGRSGESIYGVRFRDESFALKHDKPFVLSMANTGPNTNGSQFFITVVPTPWLNGKHVVFGSVISGSNVVKAIEDAGSRSGTPKKEVLIADCGEFFE